MKIFRVGESGAAFTMRMEAGTGETPSATAVGVVISVGSGDTVGVVVGREATVGSGTEMVGDVVCPQATSAIIRLKSIPNRRRLRIRPIPLIITFFMPIVTATRLRDINEKVLQPRNEIGRTLRTVNYSTAIIGLFGQD